MKKILLIALVAGLMSTSLFALDGTVGRLVVKGNDIVTVTIIKVDSSVIAANLVGTVDAKKAMLATLLTAKSTGAAVSVGLGTENGITGWNLVALQ